MFKTKKEFLASAKFNVVEAQEESFIQILDQALRDIDAGRKAQAKKRIDQAEALWGKVAKVHGVKL